jgi:hypothetical protein
MRKSRCSLGLLGLAVCLALILCAAILPAAVVSADGHHTVGMVIDPASKTVSAGETFSVDIKVTISAGEAVNTAEAHINFDPAYLEVVSITPGTALPVALASKFDNGAGTIDYAAGAQLGGAAPTTDFVLATLNLEAKAATEGTPLTFVYVLPLRNTIAVVGFYDVLDHAAVVNGSVATPPPGSLSGHVDLQGRPTPPDASWITPLTVVFFEQGTDTVVRTEDVTTDNQGNFTVADVEVGTYDIGVKCPRTLSNLVTGVAFSASTATQVDFGTLREGDANNDDAITGADYSMLWFYLGQTSGEALDKCDFNRDGAVSGTDYSLLWMNLGQLGDMHGMWP